MIKVSLLMIPEVLHWDLLFLLAFSFYLSIRFKLQFWWCNREDFSAYFYLQGPFISELSAEVTLNKALEAFQMGFTKPASYEQRHRPSQPTEEGHILNSTLLHRLTQQVGESTSQIDQTKLLFDEYDLCSRNSKHRKVTVFDLQWRRFPDLLRNVL